MRRSARPRAAIAIALLSVGLVMAPAGAPAASAGAPLSISGTIQIAPVAVPGDESHETVECVVFLIPLNRSSPDTMRQWCSGYTFSNLSPGSYLVQAVPHAQSGRWASAWYGDTPFRSDAAVVTVTDAPVTGIDIDLPRAGVVTGRVSVGGPSSADAILVAAHLHDPVADGFEYIGVAPVDPTTGGFRVGGLPHGAYALQVFDSARPPAYADLYSGGATSIDSAELVDVVAENESEVGEFILTDPPSMSVDRIAGVDRFATSAALSQRAFEPGVPVAFISNGLNWPDALSAGPAAAHLGGPLLLSAPTFLPPAVSEELERLNPDTIIVTGDEKAISAEVFEALGDYAQSVERVGGVDRYATSRAIIRRAFGESIPSRRIYIATGVRFPDAVSAGAAAAADDAPVLLMNGANDWVDEETHDFLWKTNFQALTVVGDSASIGPTSASMLKHYTAWSMIDRIGGSDRYETSRLLASGSFTAWGPEASGSAFLATGEGSADALSGVTLAAAEVAPVVLTPPSCVPAATVETLRQLRTTKVTILGGPTTLRPPIENLQPC